MKLASPTVSRHLLRGVVGLSALVLSLAFAAATPFALLGIPVAVVAWRGCPTCWAVGLAQTLERDRTRCRCAR